MVQRFITLKFQNSFFVVFVNFSAMKNWCYKKNLITGKVSFYSSKGKVKFALLSSFQEVNSSSEA